MPDDERLDNWCLRFGTFLVFDVRCLVFRSEAAQKRRSAQWLHQAVIPVAKLAPRPNLNSVSFLSYQLASMVDVRRRARKPNHYENGHLCLY